MMSFITDGTRRFTLVCPMIVAKTNQAKSMIANLQIAVIDGQIFETRAK